MRFTLSLLPSEPNKITGQIDHCLQESNLQKQFTLERDTIAVVAVAAAAAVDSGGDCATRMGRFWLVFSSLAQRQPRHLPTTVCVVINAVTAAAAAAVAVVAVLLMLQLGGATRRSLSVVVTGRSLVGPSDPRWPGPWRAVPAWWR